MRTDIAVVSTACRFPGGATTPDAYFNLLEEGRDAVRTIPADRWNADEYFDPDPAAPGKMNSKWGGFLDHIDEFDPSAFGFSDAEAAYIDPQQRLLVEVVAEALANAGIPRRSVAGQDVGVYVGMSANDYGLELLSRTRANDIGPFFGLGSSHCLTAGRVSYAFDLRGPNMAVDTACSSSLVAVEMACRSLATGQCPLAIVAGVNVILSPAISIWFSKLRALSSDGRCKAFDARADGFVRGEGCGAVVLERLEDARANGHPVLAVIRAIGTNQDGRTAGLTAPNPDAQRRLLSSVVESSGLDPDRITMIEAHGTGTSLGDPIEFEALRAAYSPRGSDAPDCWLTSAKTNLGHLEAAAGMAGLIKAVMSVNRASIPPLVHFDRINPRIPIAETRFKIPTKRVPWSADHRVAAVSAFGFSGTNAHAIVESFGGSEPERRKPAGAVRLAPPQATGSAPRLVPVSARTASLLPARCRTLAEWLRSGTAPNNMEDAAHVLALRTDHFDARTTILAKDLNELATALEVAAERSHPDARTTSPRVLFMFSGQGTQWLGMGTSIPRDAAPEFWSSLDRADALTRELASFSLLAAIRGDAGARTLSDTSVAQAAIVAIQIAITAQLARWGVKPAAVVGHSVGEISAAFAAGVLDFDEAMTIAVRRGEIMQREKGQGAMASLALGEEQAKALLSSARVELDIAAVNSPRATVVSGALASIDALVSAAERENIRVKRLDVAFAFHSRGFEGLRKPLRQSLKGIKPKDASIPIYSTLTGNRIAGDELDAFYWSRQMRNSVRFADALRAAISDGFDLALDVGPHPALKAPATEVCSELSTELDVIPTLRKNAKGQEPLLETLGALFEKHATVDWTALAPERSRFSAPPPAPTERRRFWLESSTSARLPAATISSLSAPQPTDIASAPPLDPNEVARRLQAMLASLLGVKAATVPIDVPLFDVGADSIVLIDGLARIQQEFGVRLDLTEVLDDAPTLAGLAEWVCAKRLEAAAGATAAPTDAATKAAPMPTPKPVDADKLEERFIATTGPEQRAHLHALYDRFNARTPTSKRLRELHHPKLADPRSSGGFRPSFPENLQVAWHGAKPVTYPIVGYRASGSHFWDIDGNEYVDFAMGFGVLLFGHQPPFVAEALREQLERGVQVGPLSELAGDVAERFTRLTGQERVAFCNTGTEAVMTALRIARAKTGRPRVAMFAGSYHGHFDGVLATIPQLRGSPPHTEDGTLVLEYGNPDSLDIIRKHAHELAAVIVEPVQGRRPDLQPVDFLNELRALTRASGTVLIFDEVLMGFRAHPKGAQGLFGISPDLSTYGKIVGGGLPIGAVAGAAEWMNAIDGGAWSYSGGSMPHDEPIWFAGTFNKNPLTMAAANAVLEHLEQAGPALQAALSSRTSRLADQLNTVLREANAPIDVTHFSSLFRFRMPHRLDAFYTHLNARGVYAWEARTFFLSTAHSDADCDRLVGAVREGVREMKNAGFFSEPSHGGQRPKVEPSTERRTIIAFPYAGGGSGPYRSWPNKMGEGLPLELQTMPYTRYEGDANVESFEALVDRLAEDVAPVARTAAKPVVLYGHSMGALVAHGVARRLRDHGIPLAMLIVSGEPAPHIARPAWPADPATMSDEDMVMALVAYGFPEALARNEQVLRDVIPRLRRDLEWCATFRASHERRIDVPIAAFAGQDDPSASVDEVSRWHEITSAGFELQVLEGDHFFVRSNAAFPKLLAETAMKGVPS